MWPKRFALRVSGRFYQYGCCFFIVTEMQFTLCTTLALSIDEYAGGLDQFVVKAAAYLAVPGLVPV